MTETLTLESPVIEQEIIDLEQSPTNGQIATKAFWYGVKLVNGVLLNLTVLAESSTAAREGIKQNFPDAAVAFLGMSETIMQVNG